jgi:hypothetical protein
LLAAGASATAAIVRATQGHASLAPYPSAVASTSAEVSVVPSETVGAPRLDAGSIAPMAQRAWRPRAPAPAASSADLHRRNPYASP